MNKLEQRDLEMRRARMARSSYRSNQGHPTAEQYSPEILQSLQRHVLTARTLNRMDIRERKGRSASYHPMKVWTWPRDEQALYQRNLQPWIDGACADDPGEEGEVAV